ncbi:response regulator [Caenispirillum bisanense]|uniref:response regulator n=1 Tax=Caenispirillum bisanense TaxID=414052 RepID=UPI001597095A|nr:response regulator [Caenispirillum bisanense]
MKRILLVEDQPLVRKAVRGALEDAGFGVVEAGDGEEGLSAARRDSFDLAIVDIWMPRVDGIEFLKQVRAIHADLPVIVISGGGPDAPLEVKAHLAQAHGAHEVLFKPFEDDELMAAVDRALG